MIHVHPHRPDDRSPQPATRGPWCLLNPMLWVVAVAAVAAGGCALSSELEPDTSAVVRVDAERMTRDDVDHLTVEFSFEEDGAWVSQPDAELSRDDLDRWPVEVVLHSDHHADTRFEVRVQARDAGGTVLSATRAVSTFTAGERVSLRLVLEDACVASLCEDASCHGEQCQVCRLGLCEEVGLLAAPSDGSTVIVLEGDIAQSDGMTDAGLSGHEPVTSTIDAATLEPEPEPEAVCTEGETRAFGEACGLNGRGTRAEACEGGTWEAGACDDPDACTDGEDLTGPCPDALAAGGPRCESGQWIDIACPPGAFHRSSRASDLMADGADGASTTPAASGDGRFVAFASQAQNLVPGDDNGQEDIFVHDVQTGTMVRVSIATDGTQGDGRSRFPSISADGQRVAFESTSTNLVGNDGNGTSDVFLHDLGTGTTVRLSEGLSGGAGNGISRLVHVSGDGRFVAFQSAASDLVDGDDEGMQDIFVHDVASGLITRVSADVVDAGGNGGSEAPALSFDGRFVAFSSHATNLAGAQKSAGKDILVHDRVDSSTVVVSRAFDGGASDGDSAVPSISADGRHVAFRSSATDLTASDQNGASDIFHHDLQRHETTRVSVSTGGQEGDRGSISPWISDDGSRVVFTSSAANLVESDLRGVNDVFVHFVDTGETIRLSEDEDGIDGSGGSDQPHISADGTHAVFRSAASNLTANDENGLKDVFVVRIESP